MKKKTYLNILLLLSLILLLLGIVFFGNYSKHKESFSSLCISENDFNGIASKRKESKKPLLKELTFNNNDVFFDEEDNHFYYSLVKNDADAYNPIIEWNDTLYKVNVLDNKISDNSIENNEIIYLLIYNNSQYSIAKLSCTTLPLMNVNVDVALEDIGETYQDMRMVLFDNEKNITTDLKGEIHTRGSHVMEFPKKSFKIKLKEEREKNPDPISLLGLPEGRKYILYPGYNDQERIRNVFSTNIWYDSCSKNNSFELNNGQYYKYYEMFINNKYWGLYAITYPIDEDLLDLEMNKKSDNFLKEELYKKNNGAINEYKIDWDSFPIPGYDLKTNSDYQEAWLPLKNYYYNLFNSSSINEIYDICDINNAIDIFLFYNLIQGIDNVTIWDDPECMLHNTYMFSKVYKQGTKMLYTPWDMDRTWGNGKDEEPYSIDVSYNSIMRLNPIFYLINLNDNNIMDLIADRYNYLRNNEWSNEYLINKLNAYENDIFNSGAYSRDINRWPTSASINESDKLSVFKAYVNDRLFYYDEYMSSFLAK